ncbi:hypothetical protein [Acidithiobacillus sp.]|uniref:hypothetical protein n=1 Tax=Acidithiobacillus sp. TaxID=1872118 RepID=UPI0025897FBF|nr:hypothetical protein [Acidithiobacillus sp.]MDD5374469.1 hypothetical protein [Acidithiobacillus sp.]
MTDPAAAKGLTGRAYELAPEQVGSALGAGMKPISSAEAASSQNAWKQMRDLDANWSAPEKALSGVFSGLTLGLGPAGVSALGLDKHPEENEALHGDPYFVGGDIAGMVAPALLTGGEGAAARGALEAEGGLLGRALGWTPAGMMARAGGSAEALAGRLLPDVAGLGKVGRSSLQMAARGATEGSIVNLAHTVSDSYIQDKPLTAQSLAASGVNGALLGGLAGGILGGVGGLAGAGVDAVGSAAVRSGAGTGERAAAQALKRAGASEAELGRMAMEEGGLVAAVRRYHEILEQGGESFASNTSNIARTLKDAGKGYEGGAADIIKTLDTQATQHIPDLVRVEGRIQQDLSTKYTGTFLQGDALKLAADLQQNMAPLAAKGSWKTWVASRDQLAELVSSARGGLQEDVYRSALHAMDSEISAAMDAAGESIGNKALGEQFRAAVMGQKFAAEYGEMATSKLGKELSANSNPLHAGDAGTFAWGTLAGHPLGAAGIVAARGISRIVQRHAEPAMAEAAYRSAVGAQAAKATVDVGNRVTSTLRKFMGLGGKVTALEAAESVRPKATMKGFKETMELSDKLTSQAHKAKVDDLVAAIGQMGHPELGQQMADQYMRATQYLNYNRPPDSKLKDAGSLTRSPVKMGLSTKETRYMDIFSALSNPMRVVDGILDGTVSRTAVNAVAYVMPEWHQDIVSRTAQVILEAKERGKFLPADKVVMAGVLLNAPVDSKLEKPFIDEVQRALAANGKPQPEPGKPAPTGGQIVLTDPSAYSTPLQTSMS